MTSTSPPARLEPGPVPHEAVVALSGREILQRLIDGGLPPPPFAATTRIFPVEVGDGFVAFEGDPARDFLNPLGTVHGGWAAALLDSAMACAVHSRLAAGQSYTTVEMKVNFVRAIAETTGRVRCEGRVLHFGGRVATSEGRIVDAEGRLLAHGTETCLIFPARPPA